MFCTICDFINLFLGVFQLIDSFLTVIIERGREVTTDKILLELFDFLRRSCDSKSSQISLMAHNNIILLENIKKNNFN